MSAEAETGRQLLHRYFQSTGESLNCFAKRLSMTQSTLYRFYHGRTKTVSPKVRLALNYAHNFFVLRITSHEQNPDNGGSAQGSSDLQQILKRLIEAIEPVLAKNWPK